MPDAKIGWITFHFLDCVNRGCVHWKIPERDEWSGSNGICGMSDPLFSEGIYIEDDEIVCENFEAVREVDHAEL